MKTKTTDTPRTDSQSGWAIANQYGTSTSSNLYADTKGVFVHAVFARELERENARIQSAYNELIYEVGTVHLGETRHETARRYIRERENSMDLTASDCGVSALPNVQAQR
jgi:hypothetical protein